MSKICLEKIRHPKQPFPDLMEMPPSVTSFDQANIGRKWIHTSLYILDYFLIITGSWHVPISDNWQYESTQNQIASRFWNSKSWGKKRRAGQLDTEINSKLSHRHRSCGFTYFTYLSIPKFMNDWLNPSQNKSLIKEKAYVEWVLKTPVKQFIISHRSKILSSVGSCHYNCIQNRSFAGTNVPVRQGT